MASYCVGQLMRLDGRFTDLTNGAPVNPGAVHIDVYCPDGSMETFQYPASVVRPSTGRYYYDYPITQSGTFEWRMVGTGQSPGAQISSFEVEAFP